MDASGGGSMSVDSLRTLIDAANESRRLVTEAMTETTRFVNDRIICSRLKCRMVAVIEWLGSVPRAVTMILVPMEPLVQAAEAQ